MKDIYVDTGLSQAELEKLGVEIGSYLFITSSSIHLGNENFICGKALDDRLGCYVLIELAKDWKKIHAIFISFSQYKKKLVYLDQKHQCIPLTQTGH